MLQIFKGAPQKEHLKNTFGRNLWNTKRSKREILKREFSESSRYKCSKQDGEEESRRKQTHFENLKKEKKGKEKELAWKKNIGKIRLTQKKKDAGFSPPFQWPLF